MPEDPLSRWPRDALPFRQLPRLLRTLPGGLSNASYLVEVDEMLCVLRINAPDSARYGINRDLEAVMLRQAAAAGIAPEIIHNAPEQGVLITRYLDGRHWQPEAAGDPGCLKKLLNLLDRVRQLEVTPPVFDYRTHVRYYLAQLQNAGINIPEQLLREHQAIEAMLENPPFGVQSAVVCHHDPTPVNIIDTDGKLYLLDWEYAAPGWACFDLAVIARAWQVDPGLLAAATGNDSSELTRALRLYDHLCRLWRLLNASL
jgi:thiamine kinase-like enzyme